MIWQMIEDWFRGILTDGILSNLSGLFDSVNTEVGEIATQVGTTPAGWNAGIFNMIRSLSENVIVPIAGVIITFVMCYELIQIVIEKNNLHDLDTWIFFKWIFKTFVAVLLVTNTWNIVMGVFDVTQSVVNQSAGVIISDTSIDVTTVITDIEAKLDAMSVGGLLGLWFQSLFVGLTMKALSICICPPQRSSFTKPCRASALPPITRRIFPFAAFPTTRRNILPCLMKWYAPPTWTNSIFLRRGSNSLTPPRLAS